MYEHGLTYNKEYDEKIQAKILELDGVITNGYFYEALGQTFMSIKYVMSLENVVIFIKYYKELVNVINK